MCIIERDQGRGKLRGGKKNLQGLDLWVCTCLYTRVWSHLVLPPYPYTHSYPLWNNKLWTKWNQGLGMKKKNTSLK